MPTKIQARSARASTVGETADGLSNLQRRFLGEIGCLDSVLTLLDHVPCGVFFLKDRESRIVWASRSCHSRFGIRHLESKHVAMDIVRDDQSILRTGQPIFHRAEVWYNERHALDWIVTSKLPLFNRKRQIIGIVGFVEDASRTGRSRFSDPHVGRAVAYIEKHHRSLLKAADVVRASGVSRRQLLRRFRSEFGVTLREFILKVRIHAASDALLQGDDTIAEVAAAFDFCDQSSFTRQFRRIIGITPMAYQRKYGRRGS